MTLPTIFIASMDAKIAELENKLDYAIQTRDRPKIKLYRSVLTDLYIARERHEQ